MNNYTINKIWNYIDKNKDENIKNVVFVKELKRI